MNDANVAIIGAGAAGLFCALNAARRGKKVWLLEKNNEAGAKILVSGGGRCNFTNLYAEPENYISHNPHFCRSALARFTPHDFLDYVEKGGLDWQERKHGQLFCSKSAKDLLHLLLKDCKEAGVKLCCSVDQLQVRHQEGLFMLNWKGGDIISPKLVVATGGLSFPKLGASDYGMSLAARLGLKRTDTRPALVPLLWDKTNLEFYSHLAGVSLEVQVQCNKQSFSEALLFTHRGLSGPVILQISSYWRERQLININFYPTGDLEKRLRALRPNEPSTRLFTALCEVIPRRLAELWCSLYFGDPTLGELSDKMLKKVHSFVHDFHFYPCGTEGYAKAEVSLGGVDTRELDSRTLESTRICGLHFAGEVIDVTGQLGGFNFQWAWASAKAVAEAL